VRVSVSFLSALLAVGLLSAASQPQQFQRPLVFEQNRGQAPAQVKWMAQGSSYRVLLGSEGATFLFADKTDLRAVSSRLPVPFRRAAPLQYRAVQMKLAGSRPWKDISGADPTGGVSNYLSDTDLKSWITNIPHYARVKVAGVYPGIDLIVYSHGGNLEYDFAISPGADPNQIQLVFEGMEKMRVDQKSGDLVLTVKGSSELRQLRPKIYQQVENKRVEINANYRLLDDGRAGFTLAAYDRSRPLVIDPTVDFTTFFGGTSADQPAAIAVG